LDDSLALNQSLTIVCRQLSFKLPMYQQWLCLPFHPVCQCPAGIPRTAVHQHIIKERCWDWAAKLYSGKLTEL